MAVTWGEDHIAKLDGVTFCDRCGQSIATKEPSVHQGEQIFCMSCAPRLIGNATSTSGPPPIQVVAAEQGQPARDLLAKAVEESSRTPPGYDEYLQPIDPKRVGNLRVRPFLATLRIRLLLATLVAGGAIALMLVAYAPWYAKGTSWRLTPSGSGWFPATSVKYGRAFILDILVAKNARLNLDQMALELGAVFVVISVAVVVILLVVRR